MKSLRHLLSRSGLLSNTKRPRRSEKPRRMDATQRRLSNELLEKRELLAGDILASQHNYWNGYDVNDDQQITSRDALAIINQLGRQNSGEAEAIDASAPRMFYDVNADNQVTAADALSVINALGRGEEVGELIEIMLNARTTSDAAITPDASGAISVDVGEYFDLEVSYDDLRTFSSRLGAFQLFTDIETFDADGNVVTGAISPVLTETQRLIISEDILSVGSDSVTFTIPTLPPGAEAGAVTSYVSSINDFGNNSRGEISNALLAFGYTADEFTVTPLSFDNNDLGFQVHFVGDQYGNVNLPNIAVDVNETNAADTIATQTQEFAPFLADGVTPNSAAVQFNINAFSRTFNDNEEYYSSLNRGQFDPAIGFTDIGGLASQVPLQGGGIPDVTDDGNFIEPFDAYSVRVFINRPIQGLRLQLTPGEDREATLLFGRDDFVPQDLVLIQNTDTNNNGTAQLIINAGTVTVAPGVLSVSPATVSVNEDAGNATFTVTRASGSDGAVTVAYATADGTATAGSDYTATSGVLSFADGETSKTVTVPILDDADPEAAETFTLTISAPTGGATLGTAVTSTATIAANDAVTPVPGVLSISPATVSVGEAAGTATFTVTRATGSDGAVTVDYATANGTATAGSDYTANTGTLTFADGETSKTITVAITDDAADESDETFTVTLSNATGGATLGTTTVSTATIVDNDTVTPIPGVLSISPATVSVGEAAGNATFTVTRTGGSDGAVTVGYTTANGTATAGSDYTANNGTVSFADGETSKTISVAILNDTVEESNETFTVTLSNTTGGATLGTTTVSTATIVDNDTVTPIPGVLSISPATVSVGEAAGTATFTVTRATGSDGVVTVAYATANGTATAGSDYAANSGTLTFAAGETSKTITVAIINDTADESNETFTVTLSSPTGGATLGTTTVSTATITDDDVVTPIPGVLSISPATVSVGEAAGTATFTVTRATGSDGTVTVAYATANGTATAGSDYTANSGTLTFANGETSKTITVAIINDTADESNETFTVTLSSPTGGATLGTAVTSTATIVDNDDPVVNVPPTANTDTATVLAGATTTITVLTNDTAGPASEPQQLTVTAASSTGGSVSINTDGTLNFTPNAGVTSTTISYTIQDSEGATDTGTVNVTVNQPVRASVNGSVFMDEISNLNAWLNGAAPIRNGVQDANETGFAGIAVTLIDSTGSTVAAVSTGLNGGYEFLNVAPGTYTISYNLPETLIPIGPTSATVTVPATGSAPVTGPSMTIRGTQGSAIETTDILASSYLRTHQTISTISDGGREGGLVSLDESGRQDFLIAGAGFDGVEAAQFVLSDSGDSALLIIVGENATSPSIAVLSSDYFVVTADGRGVQFFGGMEDFNFSSTTDELINEEFSNYQNAIDRLMASL
ncbi:Calx-beta domain-containing protein [Rubripirellula reticaptiva]|uniref:Serine-aspartate repeat-containing protein F n=1 Tax=Rubripirellula reticaptiva TaxID=2528013 RepID=A0A5C6FA65_9BACT|nr:Calx-beta domain-containing protein [Rubripirellula reticaptiva]TWU57387.1 Serine-aspartate repeat-containing protein F precursor [Rubripirellula reticaptiva]